MIKELQTSRTCVVCGQKKPLVAFLELAGEKGHTFGDICSTCRGSGKGRKKTIEDPGDKTDGTTRLQIDNKAKIQLEHEKNQQLKETTDREYDEKIKKETLEEEKSSDSLQKHELE